MTKKTFKHEKVQVNGVGLHVVSGGDPSGPMVIFLHGFPETWQVWEGQMEALADLGFWVWAPNQRGYHLSDKPRKVSDYSLDRLGGDVLGLIDAAGREKAVLVGHDWGATVAWWVAIHAPERVERLVVLNGAHVKVGRDYRRRNLRQILKSWYMLLFLIPGLPEWLGKGRNWRRVVKGMKAAARPGAFSEAFFETQQEAWSSPGTFRAMLNWYRAGILHFPRMKVDCRVELPVLILWGERDRYIAAELAEKTLKWCGNVELIRFPEAGHWILHEEREAVAVELLRFLRGED